MASIEALLHPTKISEDLARRYQIQSDQLARHTNDLIAQSQQQFEADKASDPVDMFLGSMEAFGIIGKGFGLGKEKATPENEQKKTYQQLETIKAKWDPKGSDLTFEDHMKKYLAYKQDVKNLDEDNAEFIKVISPLASRDSEAYKFLRDMHGSTIQHVKAFTAGKISAEAPARWQEIYNYESDLSDPDNDAKVAEAERIRAEYNALPNNNSKIAYKKRWLSGELGDELLHEGVLTQNVIDNMNRWTESDDIISQGTIRRTILNRQDLDDAARFQIDLSNNDASKVAEGFLNSKKIFAAELIGEPGDYKNIEFTANGGRINKVGFIEGITSDMTKDQIAGQVMYQKYKRLANKGLLSTAELDHLNTYGAVDLPMGKQISKTWTKEQWADIREAAQKGDIQRTNIAFANRELNWEKKALEVQKKNMETHNPEELESAINDLVAQGAPEKVWKPLSQMLKSNQSPTDYEKHELEWAEARKTGLSDVLDPNIKTKIDNIPNLKFRKEMQKEYERNKKELDKINFGTTSKAKVKDKIELSGKVFISPANGKYRGEAAVIEADLMTQRYQLAAVGLDNGLTGNELAVFVDQTMDAEWESNGGNLDAGSKGGGKYTVTFDGKFENHKKWRYGLVDIKKAAQAEATGDNTKIWQADVDSEKLNLDNKTTLDDDLRTNPNAIIDAEDFAGMAATGMYSEELKWKAAYLQRTPGQLYELQLTALLASPDDKIQALVAKYNLGETDLNPNEVDLFKQLEAVPKAANMLKRQRADKASPNQLKRIELATQLAKTFGEDLEEGEAIEAETTAQDKYNKTRLEAGLKLQKERAAKQRKSDEKRGIEKTEQQLHQFGFDSSKYELKWDEEEKKWTLDSKK